MAIQDAAQIPRSTELNTDVCVVGGGPAGISLALRLAESTSLDVIMLESGGLTADDKAQTLNEGFTDGLDYYDLTVTRHRVLGGSSHKWAGWSRPMDQLDFEKRDWVPDSGWPVTYEEMQPYYDKACELCQLESNDWSPKPGAALPPLYLPPFVGGDVEIALWQGSPPTKFGITYRDKLETEPRLRTIVNATAVEVLSTEDGKRATGVRVASLDGNEFTVSSRVVVLAPGAMETARLLLASNRANPAGLANENDTVGRYFMEHPHLVTGKIELFPGAKTARPPLQAIDKGISGARARLALQRPAGSMKVAYTIARHRIESENLLNFSTHFRTVSPVSREDSDAYQAFKLAVGNLRSPRRLLEQIRTRSLPEGVGSLSWRLIKGAPEITSVIYHEALRKPTELALYTQSEQVPNRDSRITIDANYKDALGMPQLRLDWRLSRIDKDSIVKAQAIIGKQLEEAGLGRLVPGQAFTEDNNNWGSNIRGGHHHLGTARISTDPKKGVVDAKGEAHTVKDLYVADSAVFPTGGYANPLLTVVAWALRVADTVGRRYG
ncbi:MAG: GMC family oxidoreductase [Acidimicrobiia bacterium]|nr:GMC family oxidoreductase [Acidimicrobiia bacterium]